MKVINGGGGGFPSAITVTGNSSEASIADGASFTGEWTQVAVGSLLTVDLKSDVDLTLQIQYSVDGGTTTDSSLTRYYRTGFIFPPQLFKNARPYVRVVVSNDSGGVTSTLRLNSYISEGEPLLNIPLDGTISKDYGAISTRPSDYHSEVALNRRQGATTWNKFGYNSDVDDTGDQEIIASWGGVFQYLTTGETIDIVSSSANDTNGGTGINSVVVYGVDENWDSAIEVVTMNGTSTVTTSSQWIGINRVAVFLSGSGRKNAGTISVTATTSGYDMAEMPVTEGVTQQMVFYVPRDHQYLAEWLTFSALKISGGGGSPEIIYRGIVYSAVNNCEQEVYRGKMDTARENNLIVDPPVPFPIGEKSIIWFTAETDTNNTSVSGRMSGELIRDADA